MTIEIENNTAQYEFILAHTKGGGWGKRDLTPHLPEMSFLDDEMEGRTHEIARKAHKAVQNHKHIFEGILNLRSQD